jgi:hypothetical protein
MMIACITPSNYYLDETLLTLKYASRSNKITNTPVLQVNEKDLQLSQLMQENEILRQENMKLRDRISQMVT